MAPINHEDQTGWVTLRKLCKLCVKDALAKNGDWTYGPCTSKKKSHFHARYVTLWSKGKDIVRSLVLRPPLPSTPPSYLRCTLDVWFFSEVMAPGAG